MVIDDGGFFPPSNEKRDPPFSWLELARGTGRSKIGGESSGDMPPIILAAPLIREIIRGAARFQPQASVEYFQVNFNKNQPRPAAKIG